MRHGRDCADNMELQREVIQSTPVRRSADKSGTIYSMIGIILVSDGFPGAGKSRRKL